MGAPVSHDADDPGLPNALPRQAEHERIELLARERLWRPASAARPDEVALMQPPRCQPDANLLQRRVAINVCSLPPYAPSPLRQRPSADGYGAKVVVRMLEIADHHSGCD